MSTRTQADAKKTLIITTGDTSDVDGFMALVHYAQSGADVLFIMNYPAYVRDMGLIADDAEYEKEHPGRGYWYNARQFLEAGPKPTSATDPYVALLAAYGTERTPREGVFHAMTDMGFTMARDVWKENSVGNCLYFMVGGVNAVCPFARAHVKNELWVYAKTMPTARMGHLPDAKEGNIYTENGDAVTRMRWEAYSDVLMDMNGSLAFLTPEWLETLETSVASKLRAVFVMGGVLTQARPPTLSSIPQQLNRVSCATMNQLYHPKRTAAFFSFLKRHEQTIEVYVVPSNAIPALESVTEVCIFMENNFLHGPHLRAWAMTYYLSVYAPPLKQYDFFCAFALVAYLRSLRGGASTITTAHGGAAKAEPTTHAPMAYLYFAEKYGITLIGTEPTFGEAVGGYVAHFDDVTPNAQDSEFVRNKKQAFRDERALLCAMVQHTEGTSEPVLQLRVQNLARSFGLTPVTLRVTLDDVFPRRVSPDHHATVRLGAGCDVS